MDTHSRITYKLINKDKTLSVRLTASYNQELLFYTYEWANTIIIKSANNRWVKSDSGWVRKAYEQMKKISRRGGTQAKINTAIGNEMEKYLLKKKKALAIVHEQNFDKLTPGEKNLATIIIDANQRIRIKQRSWVFLCFPPNSNFHRQFRKNDFRHFYTYKGLVYKDSGWGGGMSSLQLPYKTVYVYRVKVYNGTIKLNNKNTYNISNSLYHRTYEYPKSKIWSIPFFEGNSYQKNLTTA